MGKIVVHGGRSELVRANVDASENPVSVYLASLATGSRSAILSGLDAIARLDGRGLDAYTLPWSQLRFKHTAAIRAVLVEIYEPRTVNRMLSSIRGVLKAAWNLNQMSTDDYHRSIQFKVLKTSSLAPTGRRLEMAEIKKLVAHLANLGTVPAGLIHRRNLAILIFLFGAGLRRAEVSGFDVGDYTTATGEMAVMGKGKKYRSAYLSSSYRKLVEPWVAYREQCVNGERTEPMFVRWTRSGPTNQRLGVVGLGDMLNALAPAAGVKHFTAHDLRRSFASEMLDAGADLLMLQALLGHADLKTTKVYDRRGEAGKRQAVESMPKIE